MPRLCVVVVGVLVLLAAGLGPVVAQDATPVALPVTPDPSECMVAPRSLAALAAVFATPVAAPASPPAVAVPSGEPADDATVAGVLDTGRQLLACFNAGDYPRAFALYTDDALRQQAGGEPLTEELAAFFAATPVPAPQDARATLLAIEDVRILADGRVGAFVTQDNPALPPDGPETGYFVLAERGGRYLVDEIVPGAAPSGTPVP